MSRLERWVAGALLVALVAAVLNSEFSFRRPPLSARPQVWLSKPVDWLFETAAAQVRVTQNVESGALRFEFDEVGEISSRAKDSGASPLDTPIQTDVFVTTMKDLDLTTVRVRLSGITDSGDLSTFSIRIQEVAYSESRLVVVGSLLVVLNATVADGTMLRNVTLSTELSVDTCEPRESRVFCPFADFSGADLSRGDFELGNLRGADLTGATMKGAKLGGTDFSGAILFDVDLSDSWLVGVDINEAFMDNVDFTDAVWTR
jgi:hypothetical protein